MPKVKPKLKGWKATLAGAALIYVVLFLLLWERMATQRFTHRSSMFSSYSQIAVGAGIGMIVFVVVYQTKRK